MYSKKELQNDLKKLGILRGDTVLMHSSFKSMGPIEDGAKGFFEAMTELLGPEGTLVLPSLSFRTVTVDQPRFDIRQTPSCVGYLTEFFRTQVDGVKRSFHATHSCCAWGKNAEFLIAHHGEDNTPVGKNSPFHKLPECGGKILMLGCNPGSNTSMHGVEETAEPPYLFDRSVLIPYIMVDEQDHETVKPSYRHWFGHGHCYAQHYERIIPLLSEEKGEIRQGKVLEASCVLYQAEAVWEKGHRKLTEEPYYFVEKEG